MVVSLVLGFLLLVAETASAQCAMCRTVFESADAQSLAAAFRASVLLLLATPVACFATVAWLALRQQRRRGSNAKQR